MEHMWDTKWYEDWFFFATFFAGIFALVLMPYAIVVTVLAAMNRYSLEAIAIYWGNIVFALIIGVVSNVFVGLFFWTWSSLPAAFLMQHLERKRKLKTEHYG